jgi:hypothetical protein
MRVYPNINANLIGEAAASSAETVWAKFPNLQAWIKGEKYPTVNQLADFAKTVKLPFGYFFLNSLPKINNPLPLFRSGKSNPVFDYSADLQESIQTLERPSAMVGGIPYGRSGGTLAVCRFLFCRRWYF